MTEETTKPMPRFRFSLKTLFIVFTVIAVILGGIVILLNSVERIVGDAYRVRAMGDLLVDFMDANDERWPKDWEELESFHSSQPSHYGEFDDLKSHMEIDFSFDPATVDTTVAFRPSKPRFRATWLRNGSNASWEGAGANEIIFWYLKECAAKRPQP